MATLKEQIRAAAKTAEDSCMTGDFNGMSWIEDMFENNPEFFDGLFETPWANLSETEQYERMKTIRQVL